MKEALLNRYYFLFLLISFIVIVLFIELKIDLKSISEFFLTELMLIYILRLLFPYNTL